MTDNETPTRPLDPAPWLGYDGHRATNKYGRYRQPYSFSPRPQYDQTRDLYED